MPFEISKLREEDCREFADLDEVATRGWALGMAMDEEARRQGQNRKDMILGMMLHHFQEPNPAGVLLKATDSETGTLVSVAMWSWQLEEKEEKVDVEAPVPEEGAVGEAKEERKTLWNALREESEGVRKASYGNKPHFRLQLLMTHPDWQRKGAGSLLVKHGCEMADEAGLISVLTASAAGWHLYERHGFKIFKYHELDLRPFGVDGTEPRRFMIREPQPKTKP
ncbi:hypothetical protein M409DRAFT_17184 [Zasmidium cellare ATCC 36951]|uniref:N-acetyltransferase domain-containing protein n=1 Tax=Zasmidium cellare ATCC 36951 TaxID=1080233 RepID=A0A6A6D530_ZASCE|nr:uncharacterized protein M409DRAFT_17184 [Zasmidium cellare ATCC 36951]KAF2173239.1 hypothetical protein M409DRAFT_17184 [Zasmidium cellare ATCC 36951]